MASKAKIVNTIQFKHSRFLTVGKTHNLSFTIESFNTSFCTYFTLFSNTRIYNVKVLLKKIDRIYP